MQGSVRFHNLVSFSFEGRKVVKEVVRKIFHDNLFEFKSLDYIFCDDEYLLRINQDFLSHNDLTDIITFDLSDSSQKTGEIYISVERVKENALLHRVSFANELCRVIFHGALHLCGYGDKKPTEKKKMRDQEDYYLQTWERMRK